MQLLKGRDHRARTEFSGSQWWRANSGNKEWQRERAAVGRLLVHWLL